MFDIQKIREDLLQKLNDFENEESLVYRELVKKGWDSSENWQKLPKVLYGCMMWCFSFIDLLSSCWMGDASDDTKKQPERMIEFIKKYMDKPHFESSVAVQIWRNKLMHTSEPRQLHHEKTGKVYGWLLHWGDELPRNQHFTFSEWRKSVNLNLSLSYLVSDLKEGLKKYLDELERNPDMQEKYLTAQEQLDSYELKNY